MSDKSSVSNFVSIDKTEGTDPDRLLLCKSNTFSAVRDDNVAGIEPLNLTLRATMMEH